MIFVTFHNENELPVYSNKSASRIQNIFILFQETHSLSFYKNDYLFIHIFSIICNPYTTSTSTPLGPTWVENTIWVLVFPNF